MFNVIKGYLLKLIPSINMDYLQAISYLGIRGAKPFSSYGKLDSAGAVTDNVLWANGEWFLPPMTGARIQIVSTSIQDNQDGDGIRSLHVHFLDSDLNEKEETVVLSGTNPIIMGCQDVRFIQSSHIATSGISKAAEGTITFKNADNLTEVYNQMNAGDVRCSSSAKMVPKNKKLFLTSAIVSSISGTAAARTLVSLAATQFEGYDYTNGEFGYILIPLTTIGLQDSAQSKTLEVPPSFTEGAVVAMTCTTDKAAVVSGNFFGYLIDV